MTTILLVGGGRMGGALARGWRQRGIAADSIFVIEPDVGSASRLKADTGATIIGGPDALKSPPEVVVFAVKPQAMAEIAPAYRKFAGSAFLSIAAGRTLKFFAGALGPQAAVVRSMPNTPASVGRGFTVACANANVSAAQRALCQSLLEAVGEVAWVEDEALLDPVTAVSGSGPAYVFLLMEALAEAGKAAGLPADLAERLARATIIGSGELARLSPESAADLRRAVTSPGGTTEAALKVLMAPGGLTDLMTRAVAAATKRSRELAG
ncbi:MAG TPA: pyrroline-5-carboxylate reductase [Alphaproteobacteria bacterium]